MTHPLDGARLKVVRAQEHLKAFNEDAWRYIRTEPYQVVTKLEGDIISVAGVITAEPDAALACVVGDFVTNLRASLDYIAWELTMQAGKTLAEGHKKKIIFPLAPDQASFAKPDGTADHLQRTCGVPAAAIGVIESVQPYHAGYEPLGALDSLVRIDKHRMLLLCAGFMENAGKISVYRRDSLAWTSSGMTRIEMNLAAFSPPLGPASDYRVDVNEKPTILVSLKDFPSPGQTTWVGVLESILHCVEGVIPRFEQFF